MQDLFNDIKSCTKCPLYLTRLNAVPASVGKNYKTGGLMVIAEAPGQDEDKQGVPLVGRAGTLFNAVLSGAMMSRDDIVVTNRVRCRPPRNRLDDHPEALLQCDEWTQKELAEYQPSVVVLMGNTAMRMAYGATAKITATRGKPRKTKGIVFVPTWHPSAVLRNGGTGSSMYAQSVSDFQLAKGFIAE